MFWLSLQLLYETFHIPRIIQQDIINLHGLSCKVPIIRVGFNIKLEFPRQVLKKFLNISNFMKIHSVGAKLFHVNKHTWQNQ